MNGLKTYQTNFRNASFNRPFLAGLFLLAGLVSITGCKDQPAAQNNGTTAGQTPVEISQLPLDQQPVPASGPSSQEILASLQQRYASAKTYQDKAVLYLSYRLQGQFMQEAQPWSIQWDSAGRLASRMFNARVRGDGQRLSCYVYDIESGNLDNQHLLIPYQQQLPINDLFRDSIAKHFLAGYSELPMDESNLAAVPALIPPQLSLLTGQAPNPWLQQPEKSQRMADQDVEGVRCFVVRSLARGMTSDIWIDQATMSLVQMSLPLKLLAGEVIVSPEVTHVELIAKFHEASLDQPVPEDEFVINAIQESTPVRKFVSLPDPFPSELIGKTAPDFQVTDPKGSSKTRLYFDGKITAFLWLSGPTSFPELEKLNKVAAKYNDSKKFHVAAVFSDSEAKQPNLPVPSDALAAALKKTNLRSYYDRQLMASSRLKITSVPSVLVMDGDSRIHFARQLSKKSWPQELDAVLSRIAQGENVAGEMEQEYQRFLDSYHQQLLTVSAVDLMPTSGIAATQVGTQPSNKRGPIRLQPERAWTNSEFKKPGNVVAVLKDQTTHFFAFDGWRTIVELDSRGRIVDRKNLTLPEKVAVSSIRIGKVGGQSQFVLFHKLGKQAFLFNEQWQPIGKYPASPSDNGNDGIRDCQFTDLDSDGTSELIVAFKGKQGVHLVDSRTFEGQSISSLESRSVATMGDDVVVAAEGKIGRLKAGLTAAEESELDFKRIHSTPQQQLCGLGVTSQGKWTSVGLDDSLKRVWALSIGSQFFECEIEPVAVTTTNDGQIIWAIADTENVIHLVSGAGKWLGDFQSDHRLYGLSLTTVGTQTHLVVANEAGVECWNLKID